MWINGFVSTVGLFILWLTPAGCVTNQMTHITFYYAEQRTTLAHASAICEYNNTGHLPRIDTKPKFKLYSSVHKFQNYYYFSGNESATYWTNATRDPSTASWFWDGPGQCKNSSFLSDNIWIDNTTATDVDCAAFGLITDPNYATDIDIDYIYPTKGLFAEHCSTGHMAVCEIQTSTSCTYETKAEGWCPDPYAESGDSYEHLISSIHSLDECKTKCSNFISGDAECWALTFNEVARNCTLFYFVNPLYLLYEDTAVEKCTGFKFLLRKCYDLTYVDTTFDETLICPSPLGCNTERSCTFPITSSTIDGTSTTLITEGTSETSTTDGTSATLITDGTSATSTTDANSTTSTTDGTSISLITESILTTSTTEGTSTTSKSDGTSTTSATEGTSTTSTTEGTSTTSTSDGTSTTLTTEGTPTTSASDGKPTTSATDGTSSILTTEGRTSNIKSLPTVTTRTSVYDCLCPCVGWNISYETNTTEFDELISKLQLDSSETSSYRRSKTSAEDHRTGAKAMGWIGLVVLGLFLASIVLSDIVRLFNGHHIKRGKQKKQSSHC